MKCISFVEQNECEPSTITFNEDYGQFEIKKYFYQSKPTSQATSRRTSLETESSNISLPRRPLNTMIRKSSSITTDVIAAVNLSNLNSTKVSSTTSSLPYPYMVKAVHFISLTEIYVVSEDNFQKWKKITQDCKIIARKQPIATDIEINSTYLVKHINEWHRGRIMSTEHQKEYLCHLLDLGQSIKLKTSEIREIPPELDENTYLIKCGLFNIESIGDINEAEIILNYILME